MIVPLIAVAGCADGIFNVRQDVKFRVIELATGQPVANVGGTWQRGNLQPVNFHLTKFDGTTQIRAHSTVIAGGVFPFGFVTLLHVENGDYVSGNQIVVAIADGKQTDKCEGMVERNHSVSGSRYKVEFLSIGRSKISHQGLNASDMAFDE